MADALAIELHASGAETVSGTTPALDVPDIGALRSCLKLTLDVTAVTGSFSGSQGLLVAIETSVSGAGAWKQIGSFPLVRAELTKELVVAGARRYVRLRWTIDGTGTPSFTFSVAGEAHVLYATPEQLGLSIHSRAIEDVDPKIKAEACLRATGDAETALNASYKLPLTAWSDELRGIVADRAVYYTMMHRGFDPDGSTDALIILSGGMVTLDGAYSAAERWFRELAGGRKRPPGIVDQTPTYSEGSVVVSRTKRQ